MLTKSSSDKSSYKQMIKLQLEKLKNGEIQGTKIDLTRMKTKKH